jgi:hypothetical protein
VCRVPGEVLHSSTSSESANGLLRDLQLNAALDIDMEPVSVLGEKMVAGDWWPATQTILRSVKRAVAVLDVFCPRRCPGSIVIHSAERDSRPLRQKPAALVWRRYGMSLCFKALRISTREARNRCCDSGVPGLTPGSRQRASSRRRQSHPPRLVSGPGRPSRLC